MGGISSSYETVWVSFIQKKFSSEEEIIQFDCIKKISIENSRNILEFT